MLFLEIMDKTHEKYFLYDKTLMNFPWFVPVD